MITSELRAVARLPPAPAAHVRRRRRRRWARRAYILYYISMCIIGKPSIRNTTIFIRLPSAPPEYTKIQYKSIGARAFEPAALPCSHARRRPRSNGYRRRIEERRRSARGRRRRYSRLLAAGGLR